jgi:small-conductance mechanosensitive channel
MDDRLVGLGEVLADHRSMRDLLLVALITLGALFPARLSARVLRRWSEGGPDEPPLDRTTRLLARLAEAALWPLWSLAIVSTGFALWMQLDPDRAGRPFEVLPVLGFFLVYCLLEALLQEVLPAGPTRWRIRSVLIPGLFALAVLQQLGALDLVLDWAAHPLFRMGETEVSPQAILLAAVITLAFALSARLLAGFLRARFLPGFGIDPTTSEALATVLRYALVALGLFVALDTVGFDLTVVMIGLGALGIGVGFGLQSLVNNFVSGLIVLSDRSIKQGDVIKAGEADGRVTHIGLRSSVVRTRAGLDIHVPNSQLVAAQVTHFGHRHRSLAIELQVAVPFQVDPNRVRQLLLEAARAEPAVLEQPEPEVLLCEFTDQSMRMQLRVWIAEAWDAPWVRSDLYFAIWSKLAAAGVHMPSPAVSAH